MLCLEVERQPKSSPTQPRNPNYSQRTRLRRARLPATLFVQRPRLQMVNLYRTDDGTLILSGRRIVAGVDLLTGVSDSRKPPGRLVASDLPAYGDTLADSRDPSFGDLGRPERCDWRTLGCAVTCWLRKALVQVGTVEIASEVTSAGHVRA